MLAIPSLWSLLDACQCSLRAALPGCTVPVLAGSGAADGMVRVGWGQCRRRMPWRTQALTLLPCTLQCVAAGARQPQHHGPHWLGERANTRDIPREQGAAVELQDASSGSPTAGSLSSPAMRPCLPRPPLQTAGWLEWNVSYYLIAKARPG